MELDTFRIDQIEIAELRRPIDASKVEELADSIEKLGLLNPLIVRSMENGETVRLVAGAHRLAAMKRLGKENIPCFVYECGEVDAELMEISENLHRAELRQLQRAEQFVKWMELSSAKWSQDDSGPKVGRPKGGIRAAARELGIDKMDAQRSVKIASLSEAAKAAARSTGLDDNRSALLEAAKAPAEQQEIVIHSLAQAKAERRKMTREDWKRHYTNVNQLLSAWSDADQKTRERFLEKIGRR